MDVYTMSDSRHCQECGVELPDDWTDDYCTKCADELATFIINSQLNPGLR
jgi:hypothetical protein